MPTLHVTDGTHGYDVDLPSFFYWVRAGVALTVGAGVAYVAFVILWIVLITQVPALGTLRLLHLI